MGVSTLAGNYNQDSSNVASQLITSCLCTKPLIYISDYIFHETARSIGAERAEIMREKYFNKNVLGSAFPPMLEKKGVLL